MSFWDPLFYQQDIERQNGKIGKHPYQRERQDTGGKIWRDGDELREKSDEKEDIFGIG